MVNLKKIGKIAFLSFDNALRLHYDSIALYRDGRLPSAFLLSVLAQEELGKMHIANDFVWRSGEGTRTPKLEQEWLGLLYNHRQKQAAFLRNSPTSKEWTRGGLRLMNEVFDGALEKKKWRATYVGLPRDKREINLNGKVIHPYQVRRTEVFRQITDINDFLLVMGMGIRYTTYSLDNEEVERVMKNKRFLKSSYANWPHMGAEARISTRKLQGLLGEEILPI